MAGYSSPYVPGWGTHGLPIEQQVIKKLGVNRHAVSVLDFRSKCKEYALHYVEVQKQQFKRLGVRGDWENPYLTLVKEYEAEQIGVFGEMVKKGFIYKGLKPVYWCPTCETALAEAEIDYADKKSMAIFVKFPVKDSKGLFDAENSHVIIWTTTPWTIPANLAICVHPEFTYALVKKDNERWLIAKEMLASLGELWGGELEVEKTFEGKELEGLICRHPLFERESLLICGEHVTLEQGTGCVHTAPGHGEDDFLVGKKYGLPVLCPVDHQGKFTDEIEPYEGMKVEKANEVIIQDLETTKALVHSSKIKHSYPTAGAVRTRLFSGLPSNGLRPSMVSGKLPWMRLIRSSGFRLGEGTVFTIWLLTVAIGVFPARGPGVCLYRFFTVNNAIKRLLMMRPLNPYRKFSVKRVLTLGLLVPPRAASSRL